MSLVPGPSTPRSTDARPTVFLHVGCRKTGTSHLQFGLQRAPRRVLKAGVEQPLGDRGGIMRGLLLPLRAVAEGDVERAEHAVAQLADRIRSSQHARHLITLEALAELPAETTSVLVGGLSEFDTRLIITARSWAHTIPSEWQQRVKTRYTGDYVEYAEAVRDSEGRGPELAGEAATFRRRQDIADVARRWRAADPDLPVSVILVPPLGADGITLVDAFCQLIGIPPRALAVPKRITNESLSHADAELLRRVNIALGGRLPNARSDYRTNVRRWIVAGSMMMRPRPKIRLPRDLEPWCQEESARQLAELEGLGAEIIGERHHYVSPELGGDDFVPAPAEEVVASAAAVLADVAARRKAERDEWQEALKAAQRERRRAEQELQHAQSQTPLRRARAQAGRLKRRLLR
jgi:hypothetical protein